MVTISVDDRQIHADETAELMKRIDPVGTHFSESKVSDALTLIREQQPDIVWLDIEMPGLNGLAAAEEIKKSSPLTNIVFVTGYAEYALTAHALHVSGFLLKPVTEEKLLAEIRELRHPIRKHKEALLKVRCFGTFEVYASNGEPVHFKRNMSKEVFAYLIDRRGAGCTVAEICDILWESRPIDRGLKAQCRVILRSLKTDFEQAGAGEVIVKDWNSWSVRCDLIECDYYDFLKRGCQSFADYRGEYMSQYSWAEMTLGTLTARYGEYFEIP